jgi:hypothetical protein
MFFVCASAHIGEAHMDAFLHLHELFAELLACLATCGLFIMTGAVHAPSCFYVSMR